jgi:hypothetical protein
MFYFLVLVVWLVLGLSLGHLIGKAVRFMRGES